MGHEDSGRHQVTKSQEPKKMTGYQQREQQKPAENTARHEPKTRISKAQKVNQKYKTLRPRESSRKQRQRVTEVTRNIWVET